MNRYEETDAVVRLEDELERTKVQRDDLADALRDLSGKYEEAVLNHPQVPDYRKARAALKQLEEE